MPRLVPTLRFVALVNTFDSLARAARNVTFDSISSHLVFYVTSIRYKILRTYTNLYLDNFT